MDEPPGQRPWKQEDDNMSAQTHASPGKPMGAAQKRLAGHPPSGPRTPRISLKQWRVLHAVVDHGGYAQASEFLHLSQSAISYTIAKLQEQLGVPLLQIDGRKAHLTKMGCAILECSRHLIKKANEIEAFAYALERGWEPEIRLVVDFAFPSRLLIQALGKFANTGNGTSVLLSEVPVSNMEALLRQGSVDLAISAQVPMGFLGIPLLEVEYIAVTSPGHPLRSFGEEITVADLERTTQIVIRDFETPERRNGTGQWLYQGTSWNVSHFDLAVAAVREGHGFAWLLKYRIQELLDQGLLVPLPLRGGHVSKSTLYLVHGGHRSDNPGPAVSHLVEILHGEIAAGRTLEGVVAKARQASGDMPVR
ncbi:MAG: LysR family transcriptional regulator [Thiobacillus sp.]